MTENRGQPCDGAEEWNSGAGCDPGRREKPAWANALAFAGLPYFPFRFDTPEPLTLALLGAAFLMIAWRFCRRS